jgi:hypothetical protein
VYGSFCEGWRARYALVYSLHVSRHLIIFDVELALATRVRGDGLVLFAGLRRIQALSQALSHALSHALSCPVVSRFLRLLGGEVAGHVNHVGRCRWARGRRVMASFCVSYRVSLFVVSRLLRCVALWRTLGRPDSLSGNVVFGRERRTPHLTRRSRQLKRQFWRSLASPGCLSSPCLRAAGGWQPIPRRGGPRSSLASAGASRGPVFRVRRDCSRVLEFPLLPRPFEVRRSHCERSFRPLDAGNLCGINHKQRTAEPREIHAHTRNGFGSWV